MVICSAENEKIRDAVKLLQKKYRDKTSRYLIEGERLVKDAIAHGAEIERIFVKESVAENFSFENQMVVADKVFSKMSDTVNSQGILAVAVRHEPDSKNVSGNCLVLDGLQDPGNVGTLIRTAVACGFGDIFAVNCVDLFSPKVLRSAMSAHFCINMQICDSMEEVFAFLKQNGCQIIAADMSGENVFSAKLNGKIALVLGNEGNGLSDYSRKHSDLSVALPMQNSFESLNVAVAGSVIMYRIYMDK